MTPTTHAEYEKKLRQLYDKGMARHQILSRAIIDERRAIFTIGRPGESNFWAEIAALTTGVLVHGDVDTVLFGRTAERTWRGKLRWMCRTDHDYAREKASIGTDYDIAWSFDPDVAARQILSWRRDGMIPKDVAREAMEALENGERHDAQNIIGSHDFELSLGMVTAPRVIAAVAAVTKLCELLDAEEAAVTSHAAP